MSLNNHNDIQLLIELQTATVCFIDKGVAPKVAMGNLYKYLHETDIAHPSPTSDVGKALWQVSINRATPEKCSQILSVMNNLDTI